VLALSYSASIRRMGRYRPLSGFLFYELLDRGVVPKVYRDEDGVAKKRMPSQYVSEAVHHLRKLGVPWEWIVDETRTVYRGRYAASVLEYLEDTVPLARIDVWGRREGSSNSL
jgi:hypothetical protein